MIVFKPIWIYIIHNLNSYCLENCLFVFTIISIKLESKFATPNDNTILLMDCVLMYFIELENLTTSGISMNKCFKQPSGNLYNLKDQVTQPKI